MTPAYVNDILQRLQPARPSGANKWMACCPAHPDRRQSLSIGIGQERQVLLHCFAGCTTDSILATLGLTPAALFPPHPAPNPNKASKPITAYTYTDEVGKPLFQAVRYAPKEFRQRRPDNNGGWIWNLDGVRRVLYRLPEVTAAVANKREIWLTEGEKDADNLHRIGLTATCNPQGAGKWRAEYSETLHGAHVILLPDNDEPGRKHRDQVAQALQGIAAAVRVLELPGLPPKGDVSDWIEAGGTAHKLQELARNAPTWSPPSMPRAEVHEPPPTPAPTPEVDLWPDPLASQAYYGLAGELVRTIEPHTEADPAALLFQFLISFGNVIGRSAFFPIEASRHHTNLFGVLVGQSSRGRKGTSMEHILRLLHTADCGWVEDRVQGGLSSGEGLLSAVRDPVQKQEAIKKAGRLTGEYQTVTIDEGVEDKRLLVLESEFANTLRVMGREGNTLSPLLRQAWDKGSLRVMTKSQLQASGAHVSIIGHITREELMRYMSATETDNGFANRFLWICVRRSKLLPFGGDIHRINMAPLLSRLNAAVWFGREAGELTRDDATREMWSSVYGALTQDAEGLFGKVTSRSEAQVLRLSCLYALLDQTTVIRPDHLLAALAAWQYAEDSARYIFGNSLSDPVAATILKALRNAEQGMNRSEISALFQRNVNKERLQQALDTLLQLHQVRCDKVETAGRPSERWFALQPAADTDTEDSELRN